MLIQERSDHVGGPARKVIDLRPAIRGLLDHSPMHLPSEMMDCGLDALGPLGVQAVGKTEVYSEFIGKRTPRAVAENARWAEWFKSSPETFHAKLAMRLVDLTIAFYSKEESVGQRKGVAIG